VDGRRVVKGVAMVGHARSENHCNRNRYGIRCQRRLAGQPQCRDFGHSRSRGSRWNRGGLRERPDSAIDAKRSWSSARNPHRRRDPSFRAVPASDREHARGSIPTSRGKAQRTGAPPSPNRHIVGLGRTTQWTANPSPRATTHARRCALRVQIQKPRDSAIKLDVPARSTAVLHGLGRDRRPRSVAPCGPVQFNSATLQLGAPSQGHVRMIQVCPRCAAVGLSRGRKRNHAVEPPSPGATDNGIGSARAHCGHARISI